MPPLNSYKVVRAIHVMDKVEDFMEDLFALCGLKGKRVRGAERLLKHGYLKYRTKVFVLNSMFEINLTLL